LQLSLECTLTTMMEEDIESGCWWAADGIERN
jgi:hypothetical protein